LLIGESELTIMDSKQPVAIFDFDGTLTNQDSFLPFLRWTHSQKSVWTGLYRCSSTVMSYLLGRCSNRDITEKLLTQFYQGWSSETLQTLAIGFAHQDLPKLINPEAIAQLKWHQEQGHQVILVSAALEIYLQPWAEMMHIDKTLANRLEIHQGTITGKLQEENCYGFEKVKQLRQLLGDLSHYYLYAYGDSKADRHVLAIADEPYYRKFKGNQRIMIR